MPSSKLDPETGIVTITTPGAGCSVGDRFYVIGSAAEYGVSHADWCLRLLRPQGLGNGGHAWGVGVDKAEAELALAQRLGLVHSSLVDEPPAQAAV
jgi:hypothetical protein